MNDCFAFYFTSMFVTNLLILLAIGMHTLFRRQSSRLKCVIWLFLLVRLLCPLSFESGFGIVPAAVTQTVRDNVGGNVVENPVFTVADGNASAVGMPEHVQEYRPDVLQSIWYGGMLLFTICFLFQLYILRRKQKFCVRLPGTKNVYQWADKTGACVIGILKPKIYVPAGLSEEEVRIMVRHEKTHIKRRDYLFILGYYAVLCIYWYNPLCWLVYHMVQQDIECACDEQMLLDSGIHERRRYAWTLLRFYHSSAAMKGPVLSFANRNRGIKKRLENIGKRHKTKKGLTCLVAFLCMAAVGLSMFVHNDTGYDDMVKEMGEEHIGSHVMDVAYVDKDKIVFYDHRGIYAYDFGKRKVKGFASFKEKGLSVLDGAYATAVIAAKDGNTFYLTNGSAGKYVYNVKEDRLSAGTFEDSIGSKENVWVAKEEYDAEMKTSSPVYILEDGTKVYLRYEGEHMLYKEFHWVIDRGGDVETFSVFG